MKKGTMRWLGALLAILMLVGFAGCNAKNPGDTSSDGKEETDPLEALVSMMDGAGEMKSGKMDMNLSVKVNMGDSVIAMGMKGKLETANEKMAASMEVEAMGTKEHMEMYMADGYQYTKTGSGELESKYKEKLEENPFESMQNQMPKLDMKKVASDVKMEKDGDNTAFTFVIKGDDIKGILQELMGNDLFGEMLPFMGGEDMDTDGMKLGDINVSLTMNAQKQLVYFLIKMTMDMTEEEQAMEIGIELSADISDWNADFEVTLPEDLDSYEEMDDSGLPGGSTETILTLLFDEEGNPVADYDEIYAELVELYGQEAVDEALALMSLSL